MPSDLLLEIGTEELPASFIRAGLASMKRAAEALLAEARLGGEGVSVQTLGTPRRLALRVRGLPDAQADRDEVVVGPPWAVAFEGDGRPKKAATGFARKNGVDVADLARTETEKGAYVSARIQEAGRPAVEVLPSALTAICERVSFPKSMRWGPGEVAFGRPIHWLVALYGSEVVPFTFAGVEAGRTTRGHRFLAPAPFDVDSSAGYEEALAGAHVIVDIEARRARMQEALVAAAEALGGELVEDAFLLDECVSLVEEPHVVPGRFEPEYLALPDEVVVSVMRDHQRYFAVRDAETKALLPRYLNVVNTANDPDTIATGNDRVLRARLADARFFVDEDRKHTLASRVPRLDAVVFQAKLGSVGQKVARIGAITERLARRHGEVDVDRATQAARLCKADLETLIVGEFPELQGLMGRWYALAEEVDPEVADAIRDHYLPKGADDAPASAVLGALVAIADRADSLVGCFGIGQIPSGSADPFALRRAALGIVRTALDGPVDVDLGALLQAAHGLYGEGVLKDAASVVGALDEFFRGRLRAFYKERFPVHVVEACLAAWRGGSLRELDARVRAVDAFRDRPEYESLAIAFKRANNITKDAPAGEPDAALYEDGPERDLAERFFAARDAIAEHTAQMQYEQALLLVATELRAPIDLFFDEVLVMVDDDALRHNRLRLLRAIVDTVNGIAHFHLLST